MQKAYPAEPRHRAADVDRERHLVLQRGRQEGTRRLDRRPLNAVVLHEPDPEEEREMAIEKLAAAAE
jgi:hypothetical protein